MVQNDRKNIIIMTLQLTIIKNAELSGWKVKRLNEKQIELSRKWNHLEDYDEMCKTLFMKSLFVC